MIHRTAIHATIFALAILLATPLSAATWRSLPADSSLDFGVTFEGEESLGTFELFETEFEFEPVGSTPSPLHVTVDVRSATLFSADLDEAIAGKSWFDSATYPRASFVAQVARTATNQGFLATGTLSIKGVERELALPLNVSIEGNRMRMSGELTLSRVDFGIGTGEWLSDSSIAHAVHVTFNVLLQKVE